MVSFASKGFSSFARAAARNHTWKLRAAQFASKANSEEKLPNHLHWSRISAEKSVTNLFRNVQRHLILLGGMTEIDVDQVENFAKLQHLAEEHNVKQEFEYGELEPHEQDAFHDLTTAAYTFGADETTLRKTTNFIDLTRIFLDHQAEYLDSEYDNSTVTALDIKPVTLPATVSSETESGATGDPQH